MRPTSFRLMFAALVAAVACALSACTTTTSSAGSPGSQAGDRSGVTVFGTVDAGVGAVK
ncbi:hypothetical protein SDC9_94497 [bioreactor metagenome]|uniref:Uncharacterized protein n=1 Tax=bioreactor metagenome TaxID=1076179 RepID=A0A645A3M0_9ZZZZ